ncbi:PRD domain-containing protein [Numidum massiliense]|uniref:PRD domain-containing protein n=1 Tax=Numidum massiliense TaxID=1522315 RepID=UPI0006D5751E|nr:PRD domain-containing protein [Numidum massiliense]
MLQQLDDRLTILVNGDVVVPQAAELAKKAALKLQDAYGALPVDQVNMLVTHLATALTRLERGEAVQAPPEALLAEITTSPLMEKAVQEIAWIEREWDSTLPDEEKQFLCVHYVSVLNQLTGGGNE